MAYETLAAGDGPKTTTDSSDVHPGSGEYRYHPLAPAQIRVVHLFERPGASETQPQQQPSSIDDLFCVIQHVETSDAQYTALSYEWGDQAQPYSINVCDERGNPLGAIRLTHNLRNALFDLMRSDVEPKIFWIDQLCIDQRSDLDKNEQVPRMGDIYRGASQVLTYLGPAETTDNEALELLEIVSKHYNAILQSLKDQQSDQYAAAPFWFHLGEFLNGSPASVLHVDSERPAWAALCRLLSGGWIRRRWMVQENVLNRKTYLLRGPVRIAQANGILVLFLISYLFLPLPPPDERDLRSIIGQFASTASAMAWCQDWPLPLTEALWLFSPALCSKPHDKIFALLGIAPDAPELNITVDYTRTEIEVLCNVAIRVIEHYKDLRILEWAGSDTDNPDSLPSWVPYWAANVSSYPSSILNQNASGDTRLEYTRFSREGLILTLKGLSIGKLQNYLGTWGPLLPRETYRPRFRDNNMEGVRRRLNLLNYIRLRCNKIEHVDLVLACTLVSTEKHDETTLPAFQSALKLLSHLLEGGNTQPEFQLLSGSASSLYPAIVESEMTQGDIAAATAFLDGVDISSRSFWTLSDEYICLAPDTAEADDEVVVFPGGSLLYILRPVADGQGQREFIYVGTAFVHGFMDGSAINNDEHWREKLELFSLI